jgi:stearoyl-CoA desaturase (delta-9 desaturase)
MSAAVQPPEKFNASFAVIFVIVHALAVSAFWHFSWGAFLTFVILYLLTGCLGISLCLHRMNAHAAFKAKPWFEAVLATFATLAYQFKMIVWVATHKAHHAFSDQDKDPHSATRGFLWSHMGWMFYVPTEQYRRLAPKRMRESRLYLWYDRWQIVPSLILGAILLVFGGWDYFLWGIFFRIVFLLHCTLLINSAVHKWGYRNYDDTGDSSKNIRWLSFLTFGEALHNNHHKQETSAKHSHAPHEPDISWPLIVLFEKLGWIYDVVRPVPLAKRKTA